MTYTERPWLALYDKDQPADTKQEYANALEMFKASVRRAGDRPLLQYFDGSYTVAEVDRMTDALAVALTETGVRPGDRVALYLQNVPQYLIAQVAVWKAGGIMVAINPMNKEKEIGLILRDSGAKGLVALESLYADHASKAVADTDVSVTITTSELDMLGGDVPPLLANVRRQRPADTLDLLELVERYQGRSPETVHFEPDDVAVLTYTSGTTGPPKGAMNTHGNLVFNSQVYRDWVYLDDTDVVLGVAPLFHVTGLVAHLGVAMLVPMPLVLTYRFDPKVVFEAIERRKCSFTVASITVFVALMNSPEVDNYDLSSFRKLYSGGAPISPAVVDQFEAKVGAYIHNVYGLTETTSPSHAVPWSRRAPVDENSGALSVGVPVFNTVVRVVGEDREELPVGEVGEFVTSGPQVVPGYWNKEEETRNAIPNGQLHTGDVGFMDEQGWFYLVDRKKDMIVAGGYKVWPREVEDALYGHPAVREAAVVGIPDPYRGETFKAFVSLKAGQTATPEEIIAFAKAKMAAYKYPRQVEIIDEIPKNPAGKVLRRELRDKETVGGQQAGKPDVPAGGPAG
ncbi:MAG: class I adenylate-forming enzyme family protein [Frankiaceae bacterium]